VARLWLATGAPVVPVVSWGPQVIFDPRTAKLRPRPRTPVTVVAGPPVDLSGYQGAPPTAATLYRITETVMLRLRDLLAEVRGEPAPPLWTPQAARPEPAPGGPEEGPR
jgi:1-acyl-sn-glycerol-3-phosphate acyltransferase